MKNTDWKNKYLSLLSQFKEQAKALKDYKSAVDKSNKVMQEVEEMLYHELKRTHEIHQVLLPTKLPVVKDCEFSFKFQPSEKPGPGKDFYEVIPHPGQRSFGLVLSSCFSYSLSALLFSARLKMMSYSASKKDWPPEEFVHHLIEEVKKERECPLPLPEKISLFYAVINQKTYQMVYSLTGDIIALLHNRNKDTIKKLKPLAHSLEQQKKECTHRLSLNGRDRLLLLSPGVLNTRRANNKKYSILRIKQLMKEESTSSAHQLRNQILYDLKAFAKNTPLTSDRSILVMDIKNHILKITR